MRFLALLALIALAASGETPQPVLDVLRALSEALANQDAAAFMDQFDKSMAGFEKLLPEIEVLVAQDVSSTIDVITDEGDALKRTMELDWLLSIDNQEPRRQVVKCRMDKQGKKWKIVALEPVGFFQK